MGLLRMNKGPLYPLGTAKIGRQERGSQEWKQQLAQSKNIRDGREGKCLYRQQQGDEQSMRNQKTRWGSCSSNGNLNFNNRLLFVPEELVDYVVVHELAHRKEMNHSNAFWNVVEKYMPDYKECRKKLREYHIE